MAAGPLAVAVHPLPAGAGGRGDRLVGEQLLRPVEEVHERERRVLHETLHGVVPLCCRPPAKTGPDSARRNCTGRGAADVSRTTAGKCTLRRPGWAHWRCRSQGQRRPAAAASGAAASLGASPVRARGVGPAARQYDRPGEPAGGRRQRADGDPGRARPGPRRAGAARGRCRGAAPATRAPAGPRQRADPLRRRHPRLQHRPGPDRRPPDRHPRPVLPEPEPLRVRAVHRPAALRGGRLPAGARRGRRALPRRSLVRREGDRLGGGPGRRASRGPSAGSSEGSTAPAGPWWSSCRAATSCA